MNFETTTILPDGTYTGEIYNEQSCEPFSIEFSVCNGILSAFVPDDYWGNNTLKYEDVVNERIYIPYPDECFI